MSEPAVVPSNSRRLAAVRRLIPALVTLVLFVLILRRVPLERLVAVLRQADYRFFLTLMVPNAVVFFCWDTLILATALRWFHGPVRYSELLPARAVSYVVALFNTNLARGALAGYLARRLGQPFLHLGSTVIFLVLTEYTHLVSWAALGLVLAAPDVSRDLLLVVPGVALFWGVFLLYTRFGVRPWQVGRLIGRLIGRHGGDPAARPGVRDWALLRTFRIAPLARYFQTIGLRAPMFLVSLTVHYFAATAFGVQIPYVQLVAFLPVIFMIAALPITVAHLGTTQAAWIFFFGRWAPDENLLAFSLAAHATFTVCRALLGVVFTPRAYAAIVQGRAPHPVPAQ